MRPAIWPSPPHIRDGSSTRCTTPWREAEPERTWADTEAELLADNLPGEVTLVARTLGRDDLVDRLRADGVDARPGRQSRLAVRVRSVNPGDLPEVATGAAGVQDEGSQLVALALAEAPLDGSDTSWLDLCAGPGGKAALLAGEVAERGGRLVAVELHEHRAELVRTALRPIRGRHQVLAGDALDPRPGWRVRPRFWSTRHAPGWGPCAGAPSHGGDARPRSSRS